MISLKLLFKDAVSHSKLHFTFKFALFPLWDYARVTTPRSIRIMSTDARPTHAYTMWQRIQQRTVTMLTMFTLLL